MKAFLKFLRRFAPEKEKVIDSFRIIDKLLFIIVFILLMSNINFC